MTTQQNYAKFDSRVVSDSIEQEAMPVWAYYGWEDYYSSNWLIDNVAYMVSDISYWLGNIIQFFLGLAGVLYIIYIIISLFAKWWKATIAEISQIFNRVGSKFQQLRKRILKIFKNIRKWICWHKIGAVAIFLALIVLNFTNNIMAWNSRILKFVNIQNGYVWVDVKNEKILEPGYHLYSPLKSDFFLSRTSVFDFEIVAVTANTEEDMFVELDYRVGFTLINDDLIDFYKKYWSKSSRTVASDIVMPRVLEVLKWIIKEYSFKEISSKHNEIKQKTIVETNKVLNKIWIELNDINVLDIRLPASYTKSIEDLEKAENSRKLAEAELEKIKKIGESELLKAENEKQIKIIEAEAVAEYNNIVNNTKVTSEMLELKRIENEKLKIEKRDGKLPDSDAGKNFLSIEKK